MAETGWRITCWNADDLTIAPGDKLLFAIGRRDAMTREYFKGYSDSSTIRDKLDLTITGNRPEPCRPALPDDGGSHCPLLLRYHPGLAAAVAPALAYRRPGRRARRPAAGHRQRGSVQRLIAGRPRHPDSGSRSLWHSRRRPSFICRPGRCKRAATAWRFKSATPPGSHGMPSI